jgi:hypothetical protein
MKKLLKYLCPHTWFKKREIVFYGKYPYVDKTNPIVKSSEVKRSWIKKAKEIFNKQLLDKEKYTSVTSGYRCLGINSLIKEGFVIKSDYDFVVETNGNDDDIKIHTLEHGSYSLTNRNCNNEFGYFHSSLLGDYTCPRGAVKHIIKKSIPWHIVAPKDIVFLVLPIYYSDDDRFMATPVILDPVLSTQFHFIFWWFEKNGYETIRKGTPLAQLIPIPRKSVCESWKMVDRIPDKVYQVAEALNNLKDATKCPMYSEYKKVANDIYDSQLE